MSPVIPSVPNNSPPFTPSDPNPTGSSSDPPPGPSGPSSPRPKIFLKKLTIPPKKPPPPPPPPFCTSAQSAGQSREVSAPLSQTPSPQKPIGGRGPICVSTAACEERPKTKITATMTATVPICFILIFGNLKYFMI